MHPRWRQKVEGVCRRNGMVGPGASERATPRTEAGPGGWCEAWPGVRQGSCSVASESDLGAEAGSDGAMPWAVLCVVVTKGGNLETLLGGEAAQLELSAVPAGYLGQKLHVGLARLAAWCPEIVRRLKTAIHDRQAHSCKSWSSTAA